MPKFKKDETEFKLSVTWDGNQYKATMPKVLYERLTKKVKEIRGKFILRKDELILQTEEDELNE